MINPSFSTPFFEERKRSVDYFPLPKNGFQINVLTQKVEKYDNQINLHLQKLFENKQQSPKFNGPSSNEKPDDEILNLVLNDGDTNSLERYKEKKKKTVKRGKIKTFEPVLQAKKSIKKPDG